MTSVYNDADYLSVYKQKRRIFWVFMAITFVYAIFCVIWEIYHINLPYADSRAALPKVMVYIASGLYVIFTFPFMAIKYSRVRKYYKMLMYVNEGLKMEELNYFYTFREKSLQKDNIDVVGCVFETWSKKKQEWLEREAYFDSEKPLPTFESGDLVRYVTQSNFIVQYEIVEKGALEFEEEYEDGEEENNDRAENEQKNEEGVIEE